MKEIMEPKLLKQEAAGKNMLRMYPATATRVNMVKVIPNE
jgi:hypothetical protein